jgi:uncharacterized ion transporter superfamily protein YfcC
MLGRMTRSISKCAGRVGVEEGAKPKMVIVGMVFLYTYAEKIEEDRKESSQISPLGMLLIILIFNL